MALFLFVLFFFNLLLYFERQIENARKSMRGGGAEREERENPKQALSAISEEPDVGLEPTNPEIMT